ncbi:MAG: iron ABC transporter permease [Spirochaetaceae bacterium]|jgi:thiamine transport system permease protein|nr:iron ABC transporter permease [Spirochaetaceae bacterium]
MRPELLRALGFTVKEALFSTLIALGAGFPAAFFVARRRFPGRGALSALSAVPLAYPSLLLAIGFVSVFGAKGTLGALLPGRPLPYSFYGIILAQGFYNFPLVMRTCADAWEHLDPAPPRAAAILGASPWRTFRTVTLPALVPAIAASGSLVFLFCFFSFIIVLLFGALGTATLEVEIYHAARSSLNPARAAPLAAVETACAMAVMVLIGTTQKISARTYGNSFAQDSPAQKLHGLPEKAGFAALMVPVTLFLLAPIGAVVLRGIRPSSFMPLGRNPGFYRALGTTLRASGLSAFLALAGAFAYCAVFLRPGERPPNTAIRTLPLLPLAVSPVVVGYGAMLLSRRGSEGLYIVLRAALLWPLAYKQIATAFKAVPPEVIRAARLLSPRGLDGVFRVLLPQSWRGVCTGFAFCFAAAAADAGLPLMLAIPRFDTLALYTYRLAGSYRMNQASAAGLALILAAGAVFVLADLASRPPAAKQRGFQRVPNGKRRMFQRVPREGRP